MAEAGAVAYSRMRDFPKLIALWPHELDDHSPDGRHRVLGNFAARFAPSADERSPAIGATT
jgi:hypothetical protein